MLRGRQKDQWAHTAHLIATLVNFSPERDKNKPAIKFEDVYPFAAKAKPVYDMEALKADWQGVAMQQAQGAAKCST